MFFIIAKIFWLVIAPSHLTIWLSVAAVVLFKFGRIVLARRLMFAVATMLVLFGLSPLSVWLMHSLENAYPRPDLPAHIDGIIILGGGTDGVIEARRGVPNAKYGIARLMAAYELAQTHPEARVIFSGGTAHKKAPAEAKAAEKILTELGLGRGRLTLEDKSLNTWQNFTFSKEIAKPKDGAVWVVVTSAFHMPRAMAIAELVQWKMLPWPSDYLTSTGGHYVIDNIPDNLERSDMAVHEGIGMLVCRLTGKAS